MENIRAKRVTEDAAPLPILLHKPNLAVSIVSRLPEALLLIDVNSPRCPIVYSNAEFAAISGYAVAELVGEPVAPLIRRLLGDELAEELHSRLFREQPLKTEVLLHPLVGEPRWCELVLSPVPESEGGATYMLCTLHDLAVAWAPQRASGESLYGALVANLVEGVLVQDHRGCVIACNGAAEKIFGVPLGALQGKTLAEEAWSFFREDGSPWARDDLPAALALRTGQPQDISALRIRRANGSMICVSAHAQPLCQAGSPHPHAVLTSYAEVRADYLPDNDANFLANHDALTLLPNRRLLEDRVRQCIEHAHRREQQFSLLFLDIDDFKQVNDEYGHAQGDALLRELAQRLKAAVRSEDSVCRIGGDEFVVVLPESGSVTDVLTVIEKLRDVAADPFRVGGAWLRSSVSIGVSRYPVDGSDLESLLHAADMAMYEVKQHGRNNYQFYGTDLCSVDQRLATLQDDLREAVLNRSLSIYYQPQVSLIDGGMKAVEAFAMWRHPVQGWIPPSTFLPLARKCGLVRALSEWMLETGCEQNQQWLDEGLARLPVAINLSGLRIEAGLCELIDGVLRQSGLPPELLEVDFAESAVMRDSLEIVSLLDKLGQIGVRLGLDNFGMGFSSLGYLHRSPFGVLRLGRGMISQIDRNAGDCALVRAIIHVAHSMNMQVLADGVDTPRQIEVLRKIGCDLVQGIIISAPLSAATFGDLLRNPEIPHLSLN